MFRTQINLAPVDFRITHSDVIFTLGSCFSDCMGARFEENKFTVLSNPFGTNYNPISIHRLLRYGVGATEPSPDFLNEHQGIWHHYDAHSSFSHTDKDSVWQNLKGTIHRVGDFLRETRYLVITYGSAFVYYLRDPEYLVSNCHKQPARLFSKQLLSVEEIVRDFREMKEDLHTFNPDLHILLTVSPVRHTRETLSGNQVSKSVLRLSIEELCSSDPAVSYFPAYEIMMDDLRDYRFYAEDMIHPNVTAEKYIWELFSNTYFPKETQLLIDEWQQIKRSLKHRPVHPGSEHHRNFLRTLLQRLESLPPHLPVPEEIERVRNELEESDN